MNIAQADPKLPPCTNHCQCTACSEYFGGVGAFDLHRRGKTVRSCLPPGEVADRHKCPSLRLNNRGYWVRSCSARDSDSCARLFR